MRDEYDVWLSGFKLNAYRFNGMNSHEEAAKRFLKDFIREDEVGPPYPLIAVKDRYTGTVKRFNITREYEPVFRAMEVRE